MEVTAIRSALGRAGRALGRTLLAAAVPLVRAGQADLSIGSHSEELAAVRGWIRDYLGRPHPELGRKGPVCPFAVPALEDDGLWVAFDDALDGASSWRLRYALLRHAHAYSKRARTRRRPDLTALLVVLPRVARERYGRLDDVHAEMKTLLMTKDVMVSALHPDSTRPALWNERFQVLRAPFAAFAFRTMDVRDIVFVAHNPGAFRHYARRFGHLYASGSVSDEFGHATAFAEAQRRFA